jgi:hypothetical protein
MNRERALRILGLLPQLYLADIEALMVLVKAHDYEGARRLARRLRKGSLI